ncbi:predicted protein [Plenodomus lingam JN3]|uniref:Predicted protein n=1 Tax=Leptosphaeria maculans (strain JN3 / isolate v23.1.3 / race Av1-4-5-6-7-8) TaxID=985895 RepID=E4ZH47_LEPMJ|nr:predicted protein [Plenodomus lingam JN3]CBX90617.1 predicted protein [Plenodomus lingam JN3]
MSCLYGIVYLLFEAEQRCWSLGLSQPPFVSFSVGQLISAGLIAWSTATHFTRA